MSPRWHATLVLALAACTTGSVSAPGGGTEAGAPPPDEGGAGTAAAGESTGGDAATAGASAAAAPLPEPNVSAIFEEGCATETVRSRLLPANILFVLDRSSSMACNPPPTTSSEQCEENPVRADPATPSKWEITRAALTRAIEQLPEDTRLGISYFSNDNGCGVHSAPSIPLAPLSGGQRSVIDASLAAVVPSGATPLVGATILAYRHLHESALAGILEGPRFVVVLSDGGESEACSDTSRCSDAQECTELLLNEEVPKASGAGSNIRTFAIGAPGSEGARSVLSQLALAGGTAPEGCDPARGDCHFDMTRKPDFGDALQAALDSIAVKTIGCELPLPAPTSGEVDLERVNVIYSPGDASAPELVQQDTRATCDGGANGWQYAQDNASIQLCGDVCTRVRDDTEARVDVVLGCPVRGPE